MPLTPLATVDQLAAYLQQPLPALDPSATLLLTIASAMVRDYLQQDITATANDVVLLDPIGGAYVLLPELPVTSVTLVETLDPSVVPSVWRTADPTTYMVSRRMGMIAATPSTGVAWGFIPESWRVTYSHGFAVVPDGLVGVVLGVAARTYSTPAGAEMERIGGYQVKYAMQADGFNPLEKAALARYVVARVA
jgi:hypothetical protein